MRLVKSVTKARLLMWTCFELMNGWVKVVIID